MPIHRSPHILNAASNLLGFCLIVLTSLKVFGKTSKTIIDELTAEGLAIINSKLIAVSNDDDFGITGSNGIYQQKILPATNMIDRNRIYFIKLSQPLYYVGG